MGLALALQPGAAFAAINTSVAAMGPVEEAPPRRCSIRSWILWGQSPPYLVEGGGIGCFSLVGRESPRGWKRGWGPGVGGRDIRASGKRGCQDSWGALGRGQDKEGEDALLEVSKYEGLST